MSDNDLNHNLSRFLPDLAEFREKTEAVLERFPSRSTKPSPAVSAATRSAAERHICCGSACPAAR